MELAIPTRKPRGSGYPTCYKVDIGNETLRVAIEVDGQSHYSRRSLDAKKDKLLRGLGWTVLRFSNKQVTERLAECVLMVTSTISKSHQLTSTAPMDS